VLFNFQTLGAPNTQLIFKCIIPTELSLFTAGGETGVARIEQPVDLQLSGDKSTLYFSVSSLRHCCCV
jgi:hypothetical protein